MLILWEDLALICIATSLLYVAPNGVKVVL